ncbi:maleylacetate reductase [Lentzea sp. NBRC 102530]|uniref:maleylacetate reductase n=1 Tax=Lentzea sp. NBRC 102530 TaxID=3032201 RepID=UPI0024A396AC|nr:maleylacetate reductase [Lentzea sp. NBRC 102530]GLY46714.1 maleylacetate reductase [Lentzea sp. NBRC 102530]
MNWQHTTLGQRVLFGTGTAAADLAAEVDRLGARRVLLISSEPVAAEVAAKIDVAAHCTDVAPHVPVENAERARALALDSGADLLVSIGGGSTTGLAKAIALTTGLPIVAVPTTYAGSEATDVWGLTEASRKTTGADDRVLPKTVVYDAALTASLPRALAVASGCNALAHCVDSMWAPRTDPINQALALEGIRALSAGLRQDAREQMLYGAYLAAVAFASAGSGLHHKICHVLGGAYNVPHAETHAAILPYVLAFNTPAAPEAAARIREALGGSLIDLYDSVGASHVLHGVPDVREAAALILPSVPPSNPRAVTEDDLISLLAAAQAGQNPDGVPA